MLSNFILIYIFVRSTDGRVTTKLLNHSTI